MHKIVVKINNKRNEKFLVSLLKKFDFIELEESVDIKEIPLPEKKGDWSEIIGMWKNKDVSITNIREKS